MCHHIRVMSKDDRMHLDVLVDVSTGRVVESVILSNYPGMKRLPFQPQHQSDRLQNEFACYGNYDMK